MTSGKFNEKVEFLVQSVCSLSLKSFSFQLPPAFILILRIESNRVTHSNDVTYYRTHRTEDVYYENQENSVMY